MLRKHRGIINGSANLNGYDKRSERGDAGSVYEEHYDFIDEFHEGLARVGKGGEEFHVHPDGTPAYKERYDHVGHFSGGLAWVIQDGKGFRIYPDGTRFD